MIKIIPKIVAKTYLTIFKLISLLSLLFATLALSFYLGVNLKLILKINHIENSRFFIKVDDKIIIQIYDLQIPEIESSEENETSSPPDIEMVAKYLTIFQNGVRRIELRNIQYQNYTLNLIYENRKIFLIFREKGKKPIKAKFYINSDDKNILLQYRALISEFDLKLKGQAEIRAKKITFRNLAKLDEVEVPVFGKVENFENIEIIGKIKEINSLEKIFQRFSVPKFPIEFQSINIGKFSTHFSVSNPKKALDNLRVYGEVKNFSYQFEPALEKIRSDKFEIVVQGNRGFINFKNLKFGSNSLFPKIYLENIFNSPKIWLFSKGKIELNSRAVKKAIFHYGKLEKLPVKIRGVATRVFGKVELEPLKISILAKNRILPTSLSLDKPTITSGELIYKYPANRLQIRNLKVNNQERHLASLSGDVDIEKSYFDTKIAVSQVDEFLISPLSIHTFGKFDSISGVISKGFWRVNERNIINSSFSFHFKDNKVNLKNLAIQEDKWDSSLKIDGKYNLISKEFQTLLNIYKFQFSELNISNSEFHISGNHRDNKIVVEVDELQNRTEVGKNILVSLGDLTLFRNYVPILKKYPKIAGKLFLDIDKNLSVEGNLSINQKIISHNGKDVKKFDIRGNIGGADEVLVRINDNLFFDKSNSISLFLDSWDFNVSAILKYLDSNSSKKEENQTEKSELDISPPVEAYLKNVNIYLNDGNNSFPTKSIFVTASGKEVVLKIAPEKRGDIEIRTNGDKYILKAVNLDGYLIQKLSNFADIKGGDYNLYLKGEKGDFDGILQLRKLKIKGLDLVNNILAFINTVPALLTFSRPGFNRDGLRIIAGYISFKKRGDEVTIQDFKIKGESIDFFGSGKIDLKNQKIDMKISISAIKYFDKFIENIPIADYLILGENGTISTTIRVKGDLTNPDISTELHKELLSTPVEITKRVFNLPSQILLFFKNLNIEDEQNRENVKKFLLGE